MDARRAPAIITIVYFILASCIQSLAQDKAWDALSEKINKLVTDGKSAEAIAITKEVLRRTEEAQGPDALDVALCLTALARLHAEERNYQESATLYTRALGIHEKLLGPSRDVTRGLNILAWTYYLESLAGADKRAEADALYTRALRMEEQLPVREPLFVALILNNQALLYQSLRRYEEAASLHNRALSIREKELGPENPGDVVQSLGNLAILYSAQNKHEEALSYAKRANAILEKAGADDLALAHNLVTLGTIYEALARYSEAKLAHERALAIRERKYGSEHRLVAQSLNSVAITYMSLGKYAEAETLLKRAGDYWEKTLGPDHPSLLPSLNNLSAIAHKQGRFGEAEVLMKRTLYIREKAGLKDEGLALNYGNLGILYRSQARFAEAESMLKRSLALRESILGPDHLDVARALMDLSHLYELQGKYSVVESLYERALRIRERALGPDHPDVASSLSSLAWFYQGQGAYPKAEDLYKRSLATFERVYGPVHSAVASCLNDLGVLYQIQGKYPAAESLYKRSLSIREQVFGTQHQDVAQSLGNLAGLYLNQGKYLEARPLLERTLAIRERVYGLEHPTVSDTVYDLGFLSRKQGNNSYAEKYFDRALSIRTKALGPEHPSVAAVLNSLAWLRVAQKSYSGIEPLLKRALEIRQKAFGPDHPAVAASLNSLASYYNDSGKSELAAPMFVRSLEIREKLFGTKHRDVAEALYNLAMLQFVAGHFREADSFFDRSLTMTHSLLEYNFDSLTERERLGVFQMMPDFFPSFYSFGFRFRKEHPELIGKMYDVVLWQKGFVERSVASFRRDLERSGDSESLTLLSLLVAKRTQIATLLKTPAANQVAWRTEVQTIQAEANELEQALVRRARSLSGQKAMRSATWQDVRDALKPGEAAVEVLRFKFHDGKKWTEGYRYVALVIAAHTSDAPLLVDLGNANDLEGAALTDYKNRVWSSSEHLKTSRNSFYSAFWQPLQDKLGAATSVYVSPDGALNQLSLGIFASPAGRMVLEDYDLRIVNSTKDIAAPKISSELTSAVLIGSPNFDSEGKGHPVVLRETHNPDGKEGTAASVADIVPSSRGVLSREFSIGTTLEALPATAEEIGSVNAVLRQHGWQVQTYVGDDAREEAVKQVQHPRVLHLATHGFFLPDQVRKNSASPAEGDSPEFEDAMLRSGLYFAGANQTIRKSPPHENQEDGVFTALEGSGLNLQGTELVVLSACETGRGKSRNGEGVFGLRRALQIAGAESVLMSMWAIPDKETQELITLFYQKWLAGKNKHQALREAQLEEREIVRKRYKEDLPLYWGGFVLVGP